MTEYKSFQEILEDIDNDKNPIAQDVWNAAIEKAYQVASETTEHANEILKLKVK